MSWRSVLKESKTTSREIVNLNWDEEQLPEKDKDTCIKELRRVVEKAKNHPAIKETETRFPNPSMGEMPEEVACKALDIIKRLGKNESDLSEIMGDFYIAAAYTIDMFAIVIFPGSLSNKPNVLNIYADNRDRKYTFEELDWR